MDTPVKEIIYAIWSPINHEYLFKTNHLKFAQMLYKQHSGVAKLELWKIITTANDNVEYVKLS